MRVPTFYVNAFPDRPFSGNPAAVCLLSCWLDDDLMRKVAAENSLSATGFLVPKGNDYEIRWFTRVCELKLCGHATFASGFVVLKLLQTQCDRVEFVTRFRGTVTVCEDGDLLAMDFPSLLPEPIANVPEKLARALGSQSRPSEVLEVNQTYVAIFANQDAIQSLQPDLSLLEELHPYAVSASAPGDQSDIASRFFAPAFGIPEDPVTGSAHCFLTPYWTRRLGKPRLHARQLSERGGELWCEMAGDRVILKGRAVLTMQGEMDI